MSNYIEFTTHHREATYGNPIHDGKRPKRFREITGIRVDYEVVEFEDESIPEKLGRYLVESCELRRRKIVNDGVAFVALMSSIELRSPDHSPFTEYDRNASIDPTATDPINLMQGFHDDLLIPRHTVLPAQTKDGSYGSLHKLGDHGPVCMSSVEDAMKIMGCNRAFPVPHIIE